MDIKNQKFNLDKQKFNKFYRYSLSLTKNEDEGYDLLQTALEKFFNCKGYDKDYPESYLYTIIRNQFIDEKRRSARWLMNSLDSNESSKVVLIDINAINIDSFVSENQVERILASVSSEDSELLYLWAVEGHTIQSIANLLNIPRGTLLSRLHRLKKKLKQVFSKEYPELQVVKSN